MIRLRRRRPTPRPRDRERGQSLVEFSMVVTVFMLLLLGMLEFGFVFDQHLTLEYATREGARVGAALANGDRRPIAAAPTSTSTIIAAVQRVLDVARLARSTPSRVTEIRIYKANVDRRPRPAARSTSGSTAPAAARSSTAGPRLQAAPSPTGPPAPAQQRLGARLDRRARQLPLPARHTALGRHELLRRARARPRSRSPTRPSWPSTQEADRCRLLTRSAAPDPRPRSRGQIIVIFAGVDHPVRRPVRRRHRRLLVLGEQPAHAARGRCRGPGRRRLAARRLDRRRTTVARAEAAKNGYTNGVDGVTVTPDPGPDEQPAPQGDISGPTSARTSPASSGSTRCTRAVEAKAEYVLPVPMGSPENYYGVFGLTRGLTTTDDVDGHRHHDRLASTPAGRSPTTAPATSAGVQPAGRPASGNVATAVNADNIYATHHDEQRHASARRELRPHSAPRRRPDRLERRRHRGPRSTTRSCRRPARTRQIQVAAVLDNGGTTWTTAIGDRRRPRPRSTHDRRRLHARQLEQPDDLALGRPHLDRDDLSNSNFRVRAHGHQGLRDGRHPAPPRHARGPGQLRHRPRHDADRRPRRPHRREPQGPGHRVPDRRRRLLQRRRRGPQPARLLGDDEHPGRRERQRRRLPAVLRHAATGRRRAAHRPARPGLLRRRQLLQLRGRDAAGLDRRGGLRLRPGLLRTCTSTRAPATAGSAAPTRSARSYELYDTKNTLYDLDRRHPASPRPARPFTQHERRRITTMGGSASGTDDCKYLDRRDLRRRPRLPQPLVPAVLRPDRRRERPKSTASTPPRPTRPTSTPSRTPTARTASRSTPRHAAARPKVYGIGAMQAFTPLRPAAASVDRSSEFYLAQIDAVHAGKTIEISALGPGRHRPADGQPPDPHPDVQRLDGHAGDLQRDRRDDQLGSRRRRLRQARLPAPTRRRLDVADQHVHGGGNTTGKFNGCWLTIVAVIPTRRYDRRPAAGWWKIRYNMTRQRDLERRHDLEGRHPRQPGPPRPSVAPKTRATIPAPATVRGSTRSGR